MIRELNELIYEIDNIYVYYFKDYNTFLRNFKNNFFTLKTISGQLFSFIYSQTKFQLIYIQFYFQEFYSFSLKRKNIWMQFYLKIKFSIWFFFLDFFFYLTLLKNGFYNFIHKTNPIERILQFYMKKNFT